jgi:tRNA (cytidine/uridine-2'-O-)-methyltransferase
MLNIVLFEPEIPGNTGNIMRTCAGTGAKLHLIEPMGFSLNEKTIKRSGVNYNELCEYQTYLDIDDFFSKNEGTYYFLTRYATKSYTEVDYSNSDENIYLIFGKESTGIPKEILHDNLNKCLRIPTNDKIRALNLSNSVAIVLFEALRQQKFNDLLVYDTQKGKDYLEK